MQPHNAPTVGKGARSVAFVRPSVHLSVCPSVAYIAINSRTQRPSVPKFGMKVPRLRCDSHTSFKFKRSKVRVTDGRVHTVSAELGGHTACLISFRCTQFIQYYTIEQVCLPRIVAENKKRKLQINCVHWTTKA